MTQHHHSHFNSAMNFPALASFSGPAAVFQPSSAALLENGQPTLLSSTKQLMNIIAKHPYHPHAAAIVPSAAAAVSLPQSAHAGAIGYGSYFPTQPMNMPTKFYPSASVAASSIYATVSPPSMPIHIPIPALIPGNLFSPSQLSHQITQLASPPPTIPEPLVGQASDFDNEKKQVRVGDNIFFNSASAVISPSEALSSSPSSPSQSLEAMSLSSLSSSSSPSSSPDEEMHLADTQEENSTASNTLINAQLLPMGGLSTSNLNFKAEDVTTSFMFHPNNFLIEDYDIYAADVFTNIPSHEEMLHQQHQLPPLTITQQTPKEPPHRLDGHQETKTDGAAVNEVAAAIQSQLSPLPLATIEKNATAETNLIYDFFTNPVAQMSPTLLAVPPAHKLSSGRSGHSDDEFIFVEDQDGLP